MCKYDPEGPCDPRIAEADKAHKLDWLAAHGWLTEPCETCPHFYLNWIATEGVQTWRATLATARAYWHSAAELKRKRTILPPEWEPQPLFWAVFVPEMVYSRPQGESLIEKIKAAYRIEDLAESLTEIRWRGDRGMGKCPFHADGSPSFSVDRAKQRWNCFAGCGKGDVIDLYKLAKERGLLNGNV